ncbi:SPOR domain-containing protein [Thalassococcus sp. BH17M4-6]|uniref:SPOR domain-containing protein n=1 Tax=Thalassococcus sp. BH17M4-6 TaxID=3413148 RepID=UPI003BCF7D0D
MATYDQAGPVAGGGGPKGNLANMTNWAGALVSLALIAGVGVWGYRLLVRDVTGVPVVEATQGPMRIAPKNPGGLAADHQGLSVNAVAGRGTAADPADTLRLAPKPVQLAGEDLPLGEMTAQSTAQSARETVTAASLSEDIDEDEAGAEVAATEVDTPASDDPIQALADQIAADIEPIFDAGAEAPETAPVIATLGAAEAEPAAATRTFDGGVARSLRPQTRPVTLSTVVRSPAEIAAVPQTPEVDPETLPGGTRLVQLGAYDSPEVARTEWARLEERFGDYLAGKSRVIQRATSGGRVFYRLRAHGFADLSDARRFCAAFVSENADCIPVVTR